MAFRTILSVTSADHSDGDIRAASTLCEEIGAHLAVLVLQFAAPPPIGEYAAIISEGWLQERREEAERLKARRDAVTLTLASTAVSADVATEHADTAWSDEVIGRRARYADITVAGPEILADRALRDQIVEGVLFSSGKPLLLVPRGAAPTLKPKRVLVAWDHRVEATRAVREAIELIAGADEVRLVLVDPVEGEDAHGAEPGADAAAYLARHGAKVTVDRLPSGGRGVAAVLSRAATDFGADLMVMGGYGHSRLRQRILGGVTLTMLDETPLPILMAR